jgi:ATP-dependent RNA helicase SUPV3L1/SUV3
MPRFVVPRPSGDPPVISALLGPTNTGKTHRAIERMLEHTSGMMGLPLRLLAREVYDRLTIRVGEQAVALMTGEERRIPKAPRYWICTVEAMPLDRTVEFLAVDEVQLAGDPGRGHIYTDRLLHARGGAETWFMGSEAIAPLLRRLVPASRLDAAPRLSRLSYAGHHTLKSLPARSAIVAFRAERVYALAERIRARSGGAAVVMGALSPRTRNLQVALFQSGEVPYLVATDAIGMGLNLDVDHVAFADLDKFDGTRIRALRPLEVGQIAGRAGRHTRDGTFGTTDTCGGMDASLVHAVQEHRYPPLTSLRWRNSDLDLHSLESLRRSLSAPAPAAFLQRARADDDESALLTLAERDPIRARAVSPDRVALLWDVCRIPDSRKLLVDAHPDLLERIYVRLVDHGRLAASWVTRQVDTLDRTDGDLDALTTRLAFVRTWSYIAHRGAWLDDPAAVQQHTRAVEDRLSDALHASLTERFVDRRTLAVVGADSATVEGDRVRVGRVSLGTLRGLGFSPEGGGTLPGSIRASVNAAIEERVSACVEAPFAAFTLDARGFLLWEGHAVAKLAAGPDLREPSIRLTRNPWLGPAASTRLQRRFSAWLKDWLEDLLAPLRSAEVPRGVARGVLYATERGLGTVPIGDVADLLADVGKAARRPLHAAGVRFGAEWVFSLPMLARTFDRAVLLTTWKSLEEPPPIPSGPVVPRSHVDVPWPVLGYVPLGPALFRVDTYEAVAARVRGLARGGAFTLPADLDLGSDPAGVLRAAGFAPVEDHWVRDRRRAPGPPVPVRSRA